MTLDELVQEIEDSISFSCSLPYTLNRQETERIIKRARAWFYDNYQYSVEERIFILANQLFFALKSFRFIPVSNTYPIVKLISF